MPISEIELARAVDGRAADMPAHEARFWDAVDSARLDRRWATRLLAAAVDWIGEGRTDVVDPYALALSWAVR
ncbi:hypothetical protein ACFPM7_19565 [Actinokineospora guangxiensis]|uniref:Uncharacterized protein n=1 Tax=Actinokineospora guangxiensis TaxID=1490288 RepID=A0ABW0ER40_9PSEU